MKKIVLAVAVVLSAVGCVQHQPKHVVHPTPITNNTNYHVGDDTRLGALSAPTNDGGKLTVIECSTVRTC